MDMSTYLMNQLRNHVFRTASFAKPTNLYVSLHTADPGLTGANEATYAGYARVQRDPLDANWDAPADGQAENAAVIAFPAPSSGSQTVTHFGIWDAATVGNFLLGDALTASRLLDSANPGPEFAIGALDAAFS